MTIRVAPVKAMTRVTAVLSLTVSPRKMEPNRTTRKLAMLLVIATVVRSKFFTA